MENSRKRGFSLVELLVVLAIISILMAMYLSTFSKVRQKAHQIAYVEAMRQRHLGELADGANIAYREPRPRPGRAECRAAYRRTLRTGKNEMLVTELRYVVLDEPEFAAYWHTLIDPDASAPLEYDASGNLLAADPEGNTFSLPPVPNNAWELLDDYPSFAVMWEFLATDMGNTTLTGLNCAVLYTDGHVDRVRYPGKYPVCPTVAELSNRFVAETS